MPDMPWTAKTPQQLGDAVEADVSRRRGLRRHPRSGSGRIKLDGSDDEQLVEIKSANKVITLDGGVLRRDMIRAVHAGKELRWVIRFAEAGIEADVTVRRT